MNHRIIVILSCCFFIACNSPKFDRVDFLRSHGIEEVQKIPTNFEKGNGWKTLGGDYVYFMDLFDAKTEPKLIYILANKKSEELLSVYNLNNQIMPAAIARGVSPATIVTNYQEMSDADIAKANDMTELNKLFRAIPELKNFTWKNELQNRIASGVILKTHFIFITKNTVDDSLFNYQPNPVKQNHDKLIKEIFKGNHSMYHRPVERLNESVEMNQYISKLGFVFEDNRDIQHQEKSDKYINDLLAEDPINFKGTGKMFFFFPFKSFIRIPNKGESPFYEPVIETVEYRFTLDTEGYPVFTRHTKFVSLLYGGSDSTK